jgi:threonyl-tRNA synthetase
MIAVTLPDGSIKEFANQVSVLDVAKSIGAGLAKATLAGKINGKLVDASHMLTHNSLVEIITSKSPEGLEIIRHSCAHLMAHAVQELYPQAQVTIGPVIEDGFYYDFAYEHSFSIDDLAKIEKRMHEIAKSDLIIIRSLLSRKSAIELFQTKGEKYKVEIIQDIPGDEELSFYQQGDFIDLCRGPHVISTGQLKAFKLMKVSAAHWRGDQSNQMLQRIYGTDWASKEDLEQYLHNLEEADKRDHRKLGKRLNLFHMQEEAPGMVFWHPHGYSVYLTIEQYIRNKLLMNGYQEVKTPQLVDRALWEKSGHWDKFQKNMFTVETEGRHHALKPMNCPCHVQIYNQGMKSYRDLPLRLAEFGSCHRFEPSGALHGIMRIRNFVQDDAHIFCTEDSIQSEVASIIAMIFQVYGDFGFNQILIGLSTRPAERVGSDEIWDKAELALASALNQANLEYQIYAGEGAFYGPKIEFTLKDCLGRKWQCGTVQVDFSMPERLGAKYIDEAGERRTPVMLHRAILGSIERFIGILIEETSGALPLWLAPVQAVVMSITDKQAPKCLEIEKKLTKLGFKAISDLRNEKIGFKIREHTLQKVPYLLVIGDKEVAEDKIAVRTREGQDLGVMTMADFIDRFHIELANLGRKSY